VQCASEGWYCCGLSLQGARWSHVSGSIVPPEPQGQDLSPLPVLLIRSVSLPEASTVKSVAPGRSIKVDIFETMQRTTTLAAVELPVLDEVSIDRKASGASHQWMLRVAAVCI
jgi:hypothetical protein